jgi:hypothetical protein
MPKIVTYKQMPLECMFFGYGSLMFYNGINGRNLRHIYKSNDELIPITIKGLKRSMSAEVYVANNTKARFYSVDFNKEDKVFGMLFKIHSHFDLCALLHNEGARPMYPNGCYTTYDITNLVTNYKCKLPILTLVCNELQDDKKLYYPGYVDYVFKGIPKKYKTEFLKTGGLNS